MYFFLYALINQNYYYTKEHYKFEFSRAYPIDLNRDQHKIRVRVEGERRTSNLPYSRAKKAKPSMDYYYPLKNYMSRTSSQIPDSSGE